MTCAVLAFTQVGVELGRRIADGLMEADNDSVAVERCPDHGLATWTSEHFNHEDALIFVGSVGIAVRAVAPHVVSKTSDPAVVVVDEQGQHVVAVLSGHIGGANALARRVADLIGATPVITTATDQRGVFAVDDWATRQGLRVANPGAIKKVSGALLAGETVRLVSEVEILGTAPTGVDRLRPPSDGDASREKNALARSSEAKKTVAERSEEHGSAVSIIITPHPVPRSDKVLHLAPPVIVAGVGTRRGVSSTTIAETVDQAMTSAGCSPLALAAVASIDLKADEPGLLAFCADRGVPLRTFSADDLAKTEGDFTPSDFVASVVGVDNVCERAAVAASGGRLLTRKTAHDGVTVALAERPVTLRFDPPVTPDSPDVANLPQSADTTTWNKPVNPPHPPILQRTP